MKQKTNKKLKAHYNDEWKDASLYPDIAPWIQQVLTAMVDYFNYFLCKICRSNKIDTWRIRLKGSWVNITRSCRWSIWPRTHFPPFWSVSNPEQLVHPLVTLIKLVHQQSIPCCCQSPNHAQVVCHLPHSSLSLMKQWVKSILPWMLLKTTILSTVLLTKENCFA